MSIDITDLEDLVASLKKAEAVVIAVSMLIRHANDNESVPDPKMICNCLESGIDPLSNVIKRMEKGLNFKI